MDTVLHDLLDIHVLGEWKKTYSTLPSHIDVANNDKVSSSFSRHSVGKVLLELGKIESFINEKSYSRLSKNGKKEQGETLNEFTSSGNVNSILIQLLMSPNDFNLDLLNPDDLGVSNILYFTVSNTVWNSGLIRRLFLCHLIIIYTLNI